MSRLASKGLLDRNKPLSFAFDGRRYRGFAGDTLASALLAADVKLVGRSFKYHRPRGIVTAGPEEPNALVRLRSGARAEPNTKATTTELFDGLEAHSQNRWPSLAFDLGAINSLFAPLFVAGFYYKTFMWPAAFWEKLYEPVIRRAAGLGRVSGEEDPDSYEKANAWCDVLVIGAGPAGLSAALAAGRSGARVILCEDDFVLGGRLLAEQHEIDGRSGQAWAQQIEAELNALPEVRIMRRTSVLGLYDGNTFGALERVADHLPVPPPHLPRQRFWRIVAKRTVLASGAIERPIVFGGNDRPGVMMASAVRTYLNRFAVATGKRAAVFSATDSGWSTALELAAAGVAVEAVIDVRPQVASSLMERAHKAGIRVALDSQVIDTRGTHGLRGITVRSRQGACWKVAADTLAVSGGWTPNIALTTHLGTRPRWSAELAAFVPGDAPPGMRVVGAANGNFGLTNALQDGTAAGREAAESTGYRPDSGNIPVVADEQLGATPFWYVTEGRAKAFVDQQHDVTREDIALAAREGYRSVELLKRYTTLGMATDQGKTSNMNGAAILAALTERAIPDLGTTVFRPPATPVALGALAGTHRGQQYKPTRLPAAHSWAAEHGATFVEAGYWLRPQWYTVAGERNWLQSAVREAKAVRSSVGVCDVSTLGKIDIQGTDAATFLDRVYINSFSKLQPGRVRYGLMLREDGFVLDDGTTAHLSPGHYVMTTTTANAVRVMQHLEHARQVLWPELDVQIISVTEQWSQYSLAGPNSRSVLQQLLGDCIDLSNEAFPYMACGGFQWQGIPTRLFRISFSGELAYELAVPARFGESTLRAILNAGAAWGITPYGTEALNILRVEKGHPIGNELNGTTTAADLGLGRMMSTQKDFIGRVLASRPAVADPDRPSLVGVKPVTRGTRIYAGAHLLARDAQATPANDAGYLTSVAFSPMLEQWIGLGFLARGRERHGETIRLYDPLHANDVEVEVTSPVFFDPDGSRLKK